MPVRRGRAVALDVRRRRVQIIRVRQVHLSALGKRPVGRDNNVKPDVHDRYRLQRFVDAQNDVYEQVCADLRKGQKRGHWMWFIFPQIQGLGFSATTAEFAISSREEAARYLEHPILGPRLAECTRLVTAVEGRSIQQIFPYPDNLKFRSCMTLFAHAAADNRIFLDALEKYFGGEFDPLTLERL